MKPVPFYEMQRHNPVRSVDWRWQRAMQLAEQPKNPALHLDDADTYLAVDLIRALDRCRTGKGQAQPTAQVPAITLAHAIHMGEPARRIEIQSRLLAGQTPVEIAALLGLPTAAVIVYESLFYNVQDRLGAELYILGAAIGWRVLMPGRVGMDAEATLKTLSYFGGPLVLDNVLPLVLNKMPTAEQDNGASPADRSIIRLRAEMLIQVMQQPPAARPAIRMLLLQQLLDRACPRPRADDGQLKAVGMLVDRGIRLVASSMVVATDTSSSAAEGSDPIARRCVA